MIHPLHYGRKADQQFEALFNHASMGIVIVDQTGEIILANDFACRQFGYKKKELTGKRVEELMPPRFRQKHLEHRQHYHGGHDHHKNRPMGLGMDLYAIRKDGSEFPVEISLGHYKIEGMTYVMAFISDITIRKEQEKAILQQAVDLTERRKAEQEMLQALEREKELGELKSRFVSMASHEFRTPLSTILSSVFLLSKYVAAEDQPKREKHIDRIISSVNMLSDILNDFLSIGKIEEGKIQVRWNNFNLPVYMESIVAETKAILKEGQKISYHHQGEAEVTLDPGLLKHIVLNLLSNAIKFSPAHSPIELSTTATPQQVLISVKDYGIGISKDDLAHLFERFFRGTNVSTIQGTGLGLHIVAKYAELMHGQVQCRSELEKETEFVVTLKRQTNDEKDLTD